MDKILAHLPPDSHAADVRRAVLEASKSKLHLMVPKEEEPMDSAPKTNVPIMEGTPRFEEKAQNRKDYRKQEALKRRKKIKRKNRKGRK